MIKIAPIDDTGAKILKYKTPRGLQRRVSRHGKITYYYRDGRGPLLRLRANPGTPAFKTEYEAARQGFVTPNPIKKKRGNSVYFMLSSNNRRVKIGTSKDPMARLRTLQTASSSKIRMIYVTPGDRTKEKKLHMMFAEHRVNGEWFIYSKEIKEWIASDEASRRQEAA